MGQSLNRRLMAKLLVVALGMFAFGYSLAPIYKAICNWTGVNVLALSERETAGSFNARAPAKNTQVDYSRTITVEFDTNARGPWKFRPELKNVHVHPGELATVMFELENVQDHSLRAQAIPSYSPQLAQSYFNKLECFCFKQYTLAPGEKKSWPVVFYVSPKLSKDVHTITLSYTFFEVGTPSAAVQTSTPEQS